MHFHKLQTVAPSSPQKSYTVLGYLSLCTSVSTLIFPLVFTLKSCSLRSPNYIFLISTSSIFLDMATALSPTTLFSWRRNPQHVYFQPSSMKNEISRIVPASVSKDSFSINEESDQCTTSLLVNRRTVLGSGISLLGFPGVSLAVVKQGLLAGRIPGLSEPDKEGSLTLPRQRLNFS